MTPLTQPIEKCSTRGNGTFNTLDVQSSTPCVVQNVKMIEMWISNLLNVPVPIPGKVCKVYL